MSPTMAVQPPTRVNAFDAIAEEYDARFTNSRIGRAQRASIWRETDRHFRAGQRILEINCGTGVDAMHLAARGIRVVACDESPKMVELARRRLQTSVYCCNPVFRVLSIEEVSDLEREGQYDGVLSNFAGLNCVEDLRRVANDLARLVKPGGRLILCLFGPFCVWEIFWYVVRRDLKKAFRRVRPGGVVASLAPGHDVVVRYPRVRSVRRDFAPGCRLVSWKGVGVAVPPTYLEPWAARFPRLLAFAARADGLLGRTPGLRALADHVLMVFERSRA